MASSQVEHRPSADGSANVRYPGSWGKSPADPVELRSWVRQNILRGLEMRGQGQAPHWLGKGK